MAPENAQAIAALFWDTMDRASKVERFGFHYDAPTVEQFVALRQALEALPDPEPQDGFELHWDYEPLGLLAELWAKAGMPRVGGISMKTCVKVLGRTDGAGVGVWAKVGYAAPHFVLEAGKWRLLLPEESEAWWSAFLPPRRR